MIRILRIRTRVVGPHGNFRRWVLVIMILRGHSMWFMGNLTLTQSYKLCLFNANVTSCKCTPAYCWRKWAGSQSVWPRPQNLNKYVLYSPSHWGDRLLAGVGDVLLLVLSGVVEDQGAASGVGDDPWNGEELIMEQRYLLLPVSLLLIKCCICCN